MIYKHNEPLLICEAALHGNGNADYYLELIEEIRQVWSGWPRIAFKMQHWNEQGHWVEIIREMHGREPLKAVNTIAGMHSIALACNKANILLMSTPHDIQSVGLVNFFVDIIKLGAHDATQEDLVQHVVNTGKPIVINVSKLSGTQTLLPKERTRLIEGVSAYPANMPYTGSTGGYSCHSVPGLVYRHVVDAAHHCSTIEVHVSERQKAERPLPGDMCVSISSAYFVNLMDVVGKIWHNRGE